MDQKNKTNNVGIDITNPPKDTCDDERCPFHGNLKVHGRVFVGKVVSDKMRRTVVVSWERKQYMPKYERFEKKFSKVKAHNPDCIDAKEGDTVKLMETRPISKMKNYVVVDKVEKDNQ